MRHSMIIPLLLLSIATATGAMADEIRIGTITIQTENVFGAGEDDRAAFEIANHLHVTTRESLVRKFLLFGEGDRFDQEKLDQTERNLRALGFLRSVEITTSDPHDGLVDVTVITRDAWSTQPEVSVGSKGGGNKLSLDLTEENLFGQGRQLTVGYRSDPDRDAQYIIYQDPAILGPYITGAASFENASDGISAALELTHPFFDTETDRSWDLSYSRVDRTRRIYDLGIVSNEFQRLTEELRVGGGFALASTPRSAHRILAGLDWSKAAFSPAEESLEAAVLPEDRDFRTLFVGYQYLSNDYIKARYVDRGPLDQDFNLGTELTLRAGISPDWLGLDDTTYLLEGKAAHGWRINPDTFALGSLSYTTRTGPVNANELLSGSFEMFHLHGTGSHRTTLAGLSFDLGNDLDLDRRLELDGANGLPGYRLHAYSGDSRAVASLEHRIFSGREFGRLLTPGVAFFADAGWIDSAAGSNTIGDVGFGILLFLTRSSRNLIRADVAYPLVEDPLGRSGIVISVSTGGRF